MCSGESEAAASSVGDASSSLAAGAVNEPNEGTNSTALTFNVENLVVTSAGLVGELFVDVESACDSQQSGAELLDIVRHKLLHAPPTEV